MIDDKFTTGPWNSHIREMTGADGETRRKCFIEKNGVALAQFANFGDEDEANARLCSAAPEMYYLLVLLDYHYTARGESNGVTKTISQVLKKVRGEE